MAVPRDVGRENPDLAVGDLARRPRILTRHPARRLALLQEPGLIDYQLRVRNGQGLKRIIPYNVAQRIGTSPAAARTAC